ncbi:putative transmembrane protein [Gregarina niphandrodes]|uniref:Transmembrane protein n=1 Tax=Gregarina niphandrodes TaxID=110365 RepID=A0A023AY34_GRENI|nr:putative transmembrane protein [Gregarina niphandrodes]EZG43566.1 putative transmembrane protein [Gregarina niphandrodes]|eukprot:XP_011133203.1 putative transmembrane protein [Gregarina niphandrodes]
MYGEGSLIGEARGGHRKIAINPSFKSDDYYKFPSNKIGGMHHGWYYMYFVLLWDQAFRLPYAMAIGGIILAALFPGSSSGALLTDGVMGRTLPLWVLMTMSVLMEIWDVGRRARLVDVMNERVYVGVDHVEGRAVAVTRAEIRIGQILRLKKDDEVPAECLLLSTSNSDGTMWAVQDSLTGRRASTRRVAIKDTRGEVSIADLVAMKGEIQCSQSSEFCEQFSGVLRLKDHPRGTDIDPRSLLRTGNVVAGCEWCYTIVCFTSYLNRQDFSRASQTHKRAYERALNVTTLLLLALALLGAAIHLVLTYTQTDYTTDMLLPLSVGHNTLSLAGSDSPWTDAGGAGNGDTQSQKTYTRAIAHIFRHLVLAVDHTGLTLTPLLDLTRFIHARVAEQQLAADFARDATARAGSTLDPGVPHSAPHSAAPSGVGERLEVGRPSGLGRASGMGREGPVRRASSAGRPSNIGRASNMGGSANTLLAPHLFDALTLAQTAVATEGGSRVPTALIPSRISLTKTAYIGNLSCVDLILADKTGTLTNKSSLRFEACAVGLELYGLKTRARSKSKTKGVKTPPGERAASPTTEEATPSVAPRPFGDYLPGRGGDYSLAEGEMYFPPGEREARAFGGDGGE